LGMYQAYMMVGPGARVDLARAAAAAAGRGAGGVEAGAVVGG
jgi:hypothetical protein